MTPEEQVTASTPVIPTKTSLTYSRITPLCVVVTAMVATRVWTYLLLPEGQGRSLSGDPNRVMYFEALRYHLGEYLTVTTLKPPLTYLIDAWKFRLFGFAAVYEHHIDLILVFIMDCAAIVLLYLASLRLNINRFFAAAIFLIYSLAYVPFELWKGGSHYDHDTLIVTSLFIYCLIRVLGGQSNANLILLSVSGGLLVAQSTVNAMVSFAAVLAVFYFSGRNGNRKWAVTLRKMVIGLLGPSVVVVGLCVKNYSVAGVAATSNLSGPVAMLVVLKALDWDHQRVRDLIVESNAPEWYLWCYDNSNPLTDESGVPYPDWPHVARAYGICYPWAEAGSTPWPHDFRPLRDKLRELDEPELASVVAKDMRDAEMRPYLFAGFAPELSARWIGQYGKVSLDIYRQLIFKYPMAYLSAVARCHAFFLMGALWPSQLMVQIAKDLPELRPVESLLLGFTKMFQWITLLGFVSCVGWFVILLGGIRKVDGKHCTRESSSDWLCQARSSVPFAVLSIPSLLMSVVFSSLVGGENNRYFMQITPYLTINFMLIVSLLVRSGLVTIRETPNMQI